MPKYLFNIDCIERPDKSSSYTRHHKWRISFAGGYEFFETHKQAQAFQKQLNQWLDLKTRELNLLAGCVYQDYRSMWFVLPFATNKTISRNFNEFDKQLNLLFSRFAHQSFYTAFISFDKLLFCIDNAIELLIGVDNRHNTEMRYKLKLHKLELERIKKSIERFARHGDGEYLGIDQKLPTDNPIPKK